MKRTRTKSRSKHEILGEYLTVLGDGALTRNQISEAANLKGKHLKTLTDEWLNSGLIEWSGEPTRNFSDNRNYGRKVQVTRKGKAWLRSWVFINKLMDPRVRLKEDL